MRTMSISLSEALDLFVDEQVRQRGYGTSRECIRELIRNDQDRLRLRAQLIAGAISAPTEAAGEEYFDGLRKRVRILAKAVRKP